MANLFAKPNLTEIKKAAALAADATAACGKAIEAGIDIGEAAEECQHLANSLQQFLNVYDSAKNWNVPKPPEG